MDLFRVAYYYRPSKEGNPQEKVAFVVAKTDVEATNFVNSMVPVKREAHNNNLMQGNEVTSATTHIKNVVGPLIPVEHPAPGIVVTTPVHEITEVK